MFMIGGIAEKCGVHFWRFPFIICCSHCLIQICGFIESYFWAIAHRFPAAHPQENNVECFALGRCRWCLFFLLLDDFTSQQPIVPGQISWTASARLVHRCCGTPWKNIIQTSFRETHQSKVMQSLKWLMRCTAPGPSHIQTDDAKSHHRLLNSLDCWCFAHDVTMSTCPLPKKPLPVHNLLIWWCFT